MDMTRIIVVQEGLWWTIQYNHPDGRQWIIFRADSMTDTLDAFIYLYNQNAHLTGVDQMRTWEDRESEVEDAR